MPTTISPTTTSSFVDVLVGPLDGEATVSNTVNGPFQTLLNDLVFIKSGTYDHFGFTPTSTASPSYYSKYMNFNNNWRISSGNGSIVSIYPQQVFVVSGTVFPVTYPGITLSKQQIATELSGTVTGSTAGSFASDTFYWLGAGLSSSGTLDLYWTSIPSVTRRPEDLIIQTIRTDNSGTIIPFIRTENRTRLLKQYTGLYMLNTVSGTDTSYHTGSVFSGSSPTYPAWGCNSELYMLFRLNSVSASCQVTIASSGSTISSNNQIIAYLNSSVQNSGSSVVPTYFGSTQLWIPLNPALSPVAAGFGPWQYAFQSTTGNQTLDAIVMGWSEEQQ